MMQKPFAEHEVSGQQIPPPDSTTATLPNAEQAADLAALHGMAQAGEAEAAQAQEQAQAVASINQVDELAGIIFTAGNILSVKFPSLGGIYTQARAQSVAEALNPVFERLGWNISGGDFAIYAGAIVSVGMLANETKNAIKTDLEAERLAKEEALKVAAGLRGRGVE